MQPRKIEGDCPAQAAHRQWLARRPRYSPEGRHLFDRRILGPPDLGVDRRQRHLLRRGDLFRQDAILAVLDTGDRDHGDAARHLEKMRPRPFGVERTQHGLVLCHQRKGLDDGRSPARRFGRYRARFEQFEEVRSVRRSDTKGTRIDARMRSMMKRRGIEIFRIVPRIVPLRFPHRKSAGRGLRSPARSSTKQYCAPRTDARSLHRCLQASRPARAFTAASERRGSQALENQVVFMQPASSLRASSGLGSNLPNWPPRKGQVGPDCAFQRTGGCCGRSRPVGPLDGGLERGSGRSRRRGGHRARAEARDLYCHILVNNAGFGLHGAAVELDRQRQLRSSTSMCVQRPT